jgi:uncharacterized protein
MMLAGLSTWHADHTQIVIVGAQNAPDTESLRAVLGRRYTPFAVVVPITSATAQQELSRMMPFVASMRAKEGHATAYVCRAFTCREPVTEPEALAAQV